VDDRAACDRSLHGGTTGGNEEITVGSLGVVREFLATILVLTFFPLALRAQVIDTSTEVQTGFDTGSLSPMTLSATESPDNVTVTQAGTPGALPAAAGGSDYITSFWSEEGWEESEVRDHKGAEILSPLDFTKEGWEGFDIYVPSTGFPTDKVATIAQIFDNALDGDSSWGAMLMIQNNSFRIQYRGNEVAPTVGANGLWGSLVDATVTRDTWLPIVMHFVVSREDQGELQVWIGAAPQNDPTFSVTGIDLGYGGNGTDGWDTATDSLDSGAGINLHLGQYDWDTANYTTGETRTLFFDSITQLVGGGSAGFNIVDPVPEPASAFTALAGCCLLAMRRRSSPVR
jgi:hypothetical protein